MNFKSEFIKEIHSRGFIYQDSDIENLDLLMSSKKISGYIGFDITSDSLHVGSLVQLMLLHWLDYYGHSAIALVGGGTTLIGDPSGKDQTRKILEKKQIDDNLKKISQIFNRFINTKKNSKIVNNYEWLSNINYISFLREVGSKITLNKMLTFDSVKNRLDREQPLTILEFNYMLLQAYDFYHLNKYFNCDLQMGGSDQWGNIISGVDLIRKINGKKAFAITSSLITNSDGSKMGKTTEGAIWLDENKFSNYDFYQFWINIDDNNIEKFLKLFTKLSLEEISKLSLLEGKEINEAKKILAFEVTKTCRGINAAQEAEEITRNFFETNKSDTRQNKFVIDSKKIIDNSFSIIDAIDNLKLVKSRSEIKRLIKSNGVKVNDSNYDDNSFSLIKYHKESEVKISVGKKKIGFLKIVN